MVSASSATACHRIREQRETARYYPSSLVSGRRGFRESRRLGPARPRARSSSSRAARAPDVGRAPCPPPTASADACRPPSVPSRSPGTCLPVGRPLRPARSTGSRRNPVNNVTLPEDLFFRTCRSARRAGRHRNDFGDHLSGTGRERDPRIRNVFEKSNPKHRREHRGPIRSHPFRSQGSASSSTGRRRFLHRVPEVASRCPPIVFPVPARCPVEFRVTAMRHISRAFDRSSSSYRSCPPMGPPRPPTSRRCPATGRSGSPPTPMASRSLAPVVPRVTVAPGRPRAGRGPARYGSRSRSSLALSARTPTVPGGWSA